MAQRGHPRITVRFDPDTLKLLHSYCEASGQTVADYIRDGVTAAMAADADLQHFAADHKQQPIEGQTEIDL